MLYNLTTHWIRAACPNPDVQRQLIQHVELAITLGVNCLAIVGAALTRQGKPVLFHCYSDDLFVFQLTQQQSRCLGVLDEMVVGIVGRYRDPPGTTGTSLFFTQFEIDHADELDRYAPITGRYAYQTRWSDPITCVLRLDFELPNGRSGYRWFDPPVALPPAGQFEFAFDSFHLGPESLTETYVGPLALFLRAFSRTNPSNPHDLQLISDVGGTLVIIR